ncbi:MAG: hypothetical protein ACRDQ7_07255, partial [Haloechinothrix sp.]
MPDGDQQYQSYEERRQEARDRAGYDENATGLVGGVRNVVASVQGAVAAREAREREAARLAHDAEFRDGAPTSNVDYQGYDHTALQAMLAGVDSGGAMSTPWTNLANAMAEFSDDLNTAVNKSKAVWQGEAADTAHGFSSSMSTWSESTGQRAQLASDRMVSQSEAAATAKNSMPEPIPFSWSQEIQSWATNPLDIGGAVAESFAKQRASQDAKDEGVRVMTTYDGGLHGTASQSPAFAEPPSLSGSSGATDTTGSSIAGTGTGAPTVNGPGGAGSTGASGYSGPGGGSDYQAPSGSGAGSGGGGAPGSPNSTAPTPPR